MLPSECAEGLNFELLGLNRPDVGDYDDFSSQYWRGTAPQDPSDEEDSDSEEDVDEHEAPGAAAEEHIQDDQKLPR